MPFPSQLESQYAYQGTGESCREIVYIRYRVESLDGFSGTNGINPCSSMLMAAALVAVRAADASDHVLRMSWGVDMYLKTVVTFLE